MGRNAPTLTSFIVQLFHRPRLFSSHPPGKKRDSLSDRMTSAWAVSVPHLAMCWQAAPEVLVRLDGGNLTLAEEVFFATSRKSNPSLMYGRETLAIATKVIGSGGQDSTRGVKRNRVRSCLLPPLCTRHFLESFCVSNRRKPPASRQFFPLAEREGFEPSLGY